MRIVCRPSPGGGGGGGRGDGGGDSGRGGGDGFFVACEAILGKSANHSLTALFFFLFK